MTPSRKDDENIPATGPHAPVRTLVAVRVSEPANEGRSDIGVALRHQFTVRVVVAASHAVGNDRRQQRFHGAEDRNGDRRRNEFE